MRIRGAFALIYFSIQEVFIECLLQVDIGLRARGTEVSDEWKKSQLVTPAAISVPNLDFS